MRLRAEACALLALTACAGAGASTRGYQATGLASWYGEEAGVATASGRRFDAGAVTAAHRTLPLGSVVEVTALDTGRSALVLVDDRGPVDGARLIDLSRGAAQLLGTDRRPLSRVRVRQVSGAPAAVLQGRGMLVAEGRTVAPVAAALLPGRIYVVQVASFSDRARAEALAVRVGGTLLPGPGVWRVRIGPFAAEAAQRARDAVAARGYGDAAILQQP